ncbi:MAG: TonB-dependent receptor plug domain-containing protein, partial [Bacteroidota bacterium]
MKQKLLLFISFVSVSFSSFSQVIVTGQVLDLRQTPVPGATVLLSNDGEEQGVVTDLDGNFEITLLDTGTYEMEIRFVGYQPYQETQTFVESRSYDLGTLSLTELTRQLQSVEVLGRVQRDYQSIYSFSATKTAIENQELPQSISTVTKELMDDRQAFQLADAVEMVSGVTPSSFYNQYNIRGISQNEEGQIINGLRTRQYYFLQPITSHIERVEVLKGPASVTFSSVDPGGSINMVTKKPLE